ncbi:histidine phosphatase family protein [Salirhabdus salicampi]|uniref:histidine phosphatase family protein n=1 Tax=Salirhabdus salicampi TaxID=476102 RepID=UPI0020C28AE1|nr:histidine phosphatase family protein [Salirhabdus salicampi]MCP8615415.1 histidine phosphatase family protein [Salirhabdus salicampi]
MSTTIFFVRHAHSIYTPDELRRPLSNRGMEDTKRVTNRLKQEEIDCVISSPYKRAIQTVEGVAKQLNQKVIIEADLRERKLAGVSVDNFDYASEKVWSDYSFSWSGGESNVVAQQRGVKTMMWILQTYKGENIVIGTHGNIMVLIMNYFDEKYGYSFWKQLNMPDIYKLSFHDRSLKTVEHIPI